MSPCCLLRDVTCSVTSQWLTQRCRRLRRDPGSRCGQCQVPGCLIITLIIPASITHHNVTNHSLSRHWRPLIGHSNQLRTWLVNIHIAGLPFADLLHRWSVSQDEKLSHHLQSSSHTHAPQFVVWGIGAHSSSIFNIPNSRAQWDWIKMSNKIRILKRFCVVIATYFVRMFWPCQDSSRFLINFTFVVAVAFRD